MLSVGFGSLRRVAGVVLLAAVLHAGAAAAPPDPSDAQAQIREIMDRVVGVLRDYGDNDDPEQLREAIRAIVMPHLDFVTMTKLAIGRSWLDATAEQKRALVEEFRALLVRTYGSSIGEYDNQQFDVELLPLQPGERDDRATVRSRVIQADGRDVPVHYRLHYDDDDEWRVYDIVVDGVSLVTTYRSTFVSRIHSGGISALIEELERKNERDATLDTPS